MKKIGLIGGLSPESTLYYYESFVKMCRECFEPGFYPDLMIYSLNFREFADHPRGWEGREEMLAAAAKSLERAGAEIIGITANTPHIVFPEVSESVRVPMLSIIDALGAEAKKRGLNNLLLLGTKTTMSMPFYREALEKMGFGVVIPAEEEMNEVDRIIRRELMFDNLAGRPYLLNLIGKYSDASDAVILGCTELPLAVKEGDADTEVLDTAIIHMKAILEAARGD